MKVYISVDIEGVAGICDWKETDMGGENYEQYRQQMMQETVACINGLKEAGVEEIIVRDAHDSARNLNIHELPQGITIIRGWERRPCDMLAGLDESFDACIFIGYHSPSRSNANPLSHTLNTRHMHIKFNDKIVSEFHLNAYYAQANNVPVILVSGDQGLADIVKSENNNITTVATKKGLHGAVISKHPLDACEEIKTKAKEAILKLKDKKAKDFFIKLDQPIDVEIFFRTHMQAHYASHYPNSYKKDDDIIGYTAKNIMDALIFILFVDK